MIEFLPLPDDHPDLAASPMLRGARHILGYALEHEGIGLTATKAFKRDFVHWAVENFEWPGKSPEEMFRYHRVVNEADFQPLELLHFLLIRLRLGRHYKGRFLATNDGRMYAGQAGALFDKLVPFFLLAMDHAAYSRIGEAPPGNWDTWLNVMNVEIEDGVSEPKLFGVFYGEGPDWDNDGWRQIGTFSSCVLKPLEWAGLITLQETREPDGRTAHMIFKAPLWRSALKLETDEMVRPAVRH
ncbi:hypothetical protein [Paenirhodobacter populi]|uniref:hypothetical protein n=1 Tax=Paenirhodobacter populi TaxID=2306993 RepID=UPI000FE3053F|nr:hypothetical protein [Sinirhodobacter populi]RWR04139.1 hypothetical protein D2T32_20555 [Sinirhodobacter populi]